MTDILSRLHIKKKADSVKLPAKRSMNLYIKVKDGNSWQVILPLAIFLMLVVFAIYRLGVVNRLNKLNELRHENTTLEAQLNTLNKQLEAFPELKEEYRRYTTGYLAADEVGLVKRTRVFEMLKESTDGIASIKNVSVEGNQVGMIVDIASLEDIELIQDRLNAMPNIDEIKVSTAKGTNNVEVEGYIIFTVREDTSDAAASAAGSTFMSEEEKAARYASYSQAAADARALAEAADNSYGRTAAGTGASGSTGTASGSAASAGSTGSGSSASGSSSAGNAAGAAQAGSSAGAQAASGSAGSTSSGSSQQVQNIGGDEVVVVPQGELPAGFDSLEQGMSALSASGGGN